MRFWMTGKAGTWRLAEVSRGYSYHNYLRGAVNFVVRYREMYVCYARRTKGYD
jgi:hypothetical protein